MGLLARNDGRQAKTAPLTPDVFITDWAITEVDACAGVESSSLQLIFLGHTFRGHSVDPRSNQTDSQDRLSVSLVLKMACCHEALGCQEDVCVKAPLSRCLKKTSLSLGQPVRTFWKLL